MIRFALFGVLGPFIGLMVAVSLGGGFKSHAAESFAIVLPFAFLVGVIPALAAAALDRIFEVWGARPLQRYLLAALAGYAAAYVLMVKSLIETLPLSFGYGWGF